MKWLHFSDFHIGGPRAPQANALGSLIDAIKNIYERTGEVVDAVFLAGDLAYSGKKAEYDRFRDDFYLPLLSLPNVANAKVFAVPGNHDVDCDIGVPTTWDILGRKQQTFFAEDDDGRRDRKHRAEVFAAYREFINAHNILSPDPSTEVSRIYDEDNFPVSIMATNTAFFSDERENRRPRSTPIPLTSLRALIRGDSKPKPLLVLGHHSPEAFRSDHFGLFKQFLKENRAFYLHGHEHDPSAVFNSDASLRTLGFGATYLQSLETAAEAPYKNSFTFCTVAEKLIITAFSWERGSWRDTTSLQFSDCEVLDRTPFERVAVMLPAIDGAQSQRSGEIPLSRIPRAHPEPTSILPVAAPSEQLWLRLVQMSESVRRITQEGELSVTTLPQQDGKWQGVLEVKGRRHLVICIPGANHVLSAKEVETLNTRLDTEDLGSVTVISLGLFSDDARAMYLRLKSRKAIEVLVNSDLTANADQILSSEQKRHIHKLEAATSSVRILVTEAEILCLVITGNSPSVTFYLIRQDGTTLNPADPIVSALRKGTPDLVNAAYIGEAYQELLSVAPTFDERLYLQQSFSEYNSTKYAALANIGIRFSDLPLKDLYVNATAAESEDVTRNGRIEDIVEDHLAKFPASDALKSHIRRQLLETFNQDGRQETSDAREFCQKYGSVLLTGDPGSGKTCFVKNEILAYCERALNDASNKDSEAYGWHSAHVPIMLQLSELVGEADFEKVGLFGIANRVLSRRSLIFPEEQIRAMAAAGKLALFFDGLDEIVSVEKRALIVRHINEFVTTYLPFGNRVVVTSRPAAVHVVDLLPALHKLELQGLSEDNIRMLAERVLSLKVVDSPDGVRVAEERPATSDTTLVERLLRDCREKPGVGRLAQNPLLLTLLILIYANSGALSAKRHLIYEEAIKTLSSVRGREAGHAPISTQDLRERLGAIALSVYKKESGLLPTRAEVREQVRVVMSKQRAEQVGADEADDFIQKVAESTGLITIGGRRDEGNENAVVTFMHHSFLEYFAAIGLSLELEAIRLEELVHEPRWHEILTLLSGIIGESSDIGPVLSRFLQSTTEVSEVDARLLLFSMDCALESDIPSEAAQRLIAREIARSISAGAARVDPWVQAEIGRRLGALFASCGASEFEKVLSELIRDKDGDKCAAAIRIAGYGCKSGYSSDLLIEAVNGACARDEENVAGAICWAAGHANCFRTEPALQLIVENLDRTRKRRQYAFEAIAKLPTLAAQHWSEIINGMDDDDGSVRKAASNAAVQAGINADLAAMNAHRKDIVLRALQGYDGTGSQERAAKVKSVTLERMLDSGDRRTRLVGIRLVPMVDQNELFVIEKLFSILNDRDDREEIVAALDALRYSGEALSLVSATQIKLIGEWVSRGTGDIREAGTRLLGMFGRDLTAVNLLLRLDPSAMMTNEYEAFMSAIGSARVLRTDASDIAASQAGRLLDPKTTMSEENVRRVCSSLDALRRLEQNVPDRLAKRVAFVVEDFRINEKVRGKALLALPTIAIPSVRVVSKITQWLERASPEFEGELVQLPSVVARKCKQNVDYVIACVSALAGLRQAAVKLHRKLSAREATGDNQFRVTELRSGIEDVTSIIVAFDEFIKK